MAPFGIMMAALIGASGTGAAEEQQVKGVTKSVAPAHTVDKVQEMEKRERTSAPPRQLHQAAPHHETVPNKPFPEVKKKPGSPNLDKSLLIPPSRPNERSAKLQASAAPPLNRSFPGLTDTNWIPPDTQGAAGPAHLMEILNGGVGVFEKATGTLRSQVTLQTFWSSLGTAVGEPANFAFDPKVLYDQFAGRFVAITAGGGRNNPNNSFIMIGVSATSDPTGEWFLYAIDADRFNGQQFDEWADFPGLGLDARNYYVTANMLPNTGGGTSSRKLWVIPKQPLLQNSLTVQFTEFRTLLLGSGIRPSHTFGDAEYHYLVSSNWFIGSDPGPNALRLGRIRFLPDPVYEDLGFIAVNQYFSAPPAPQQGGVPTLEVVNLAPNNVVFRNGRLWTVNHVGSADHQRVEVAWYEIDPTEASLSEAGSPVQEGRISDSVMSFFYPSIGVNRDNHVMIGFSASSPGMYAGAYYTAREAGDPPGSMQPVELMQEGLGPYYKTFGAGRNRWGDYSATTVDPEDDRTFWTIQEYAETPIGAGTLDGQGRWGTWWASAKFGIFNLTITKNGSGAGTVVSAPAGIDCGSTCQAVFGTGASVVLTATAASGSTFAGWSGGNCTGTGTCTVASESAVTATFNTIPPPPPPPSTVSGDDGGGGCVLNPSSPFDPFLPLLVAVSIGYLIWRQRRRRQ
jgi:hypothetical protein